MTERPQPIALHASCVLVGESGILLRGPAGSGKSSLARRVVETAQRQGLFARLVGDDRILVSLASGRLLAGPHPALAGAIEVRGVGILAVANVSGAVIRLVVDCDVESERFPSENQRVTQICGVTLPRLVAGAEEADKVLLMLTAVHSALETEPPTP